MTEEDGRVVVTFKVGDSFPSGEGFVSFVQDTYLIPLFSSYLYIIYMGVEHVFWRLNGFVERPA